MSLSLLSLCWIKRNAAKTPTKLRLDKSELDDLIKSRKIKKNKKKLGKKSEPVNNTQTNNQDDEDNSIFEKYNLGNYDDEG
jgi:hypothetical protein